MRGARFDEFKEHSDNVNELSEHAKDSAELYHESEERLAWIDSKMKELISGGDRELSESLEKNKTEAKEDVRLKEEEAERIKSEIEKELQQQSEYQRCCIEDMKLFEEFEADGEDVSDAKGIIEERQTEIQKNIDMLNSSLEILRQKYAH